jgi:hypothetical protein
MATKNATRPPEDEGTSPEAKDCQDLDEAIVSSHLKGLCVYLDAIGYDDAPVAPDLPVAEWPAAAKAAALAMATWAVCSMPNLNPHRGPEGQDDMLAKTMVAFRGLAELILGRLDEAQWAFQALRAIRTITIVEGWRLEAVEHVEHVDAEEVAG